VILVFIFQGCAVGQQSPEEVLIREPGSRTYNDPISTASIAKELLTYAVISAAAYDSSSAILQEAAAKGETTKPRGTRMPASTAAAQQERDCDWIDGTLPNPSGWVRWDFPDKASQTRAANLGLSLGVWESMEGPKEVAVVFRGTDFESWRDWISNLRWILWITRFIPWYEDQYTEVSRRVGGEFVAALKAKSRQWTDEQRRTLRIVSAGHSLGGGLAQHFAYAYPYGGPWKVSSVYAFDPSPVTGWFSVDKGLREHNATGLRIDRVFEHGELLAYFRLLVGYLISPSAANPAIRQIRFNYVQTLNPIASHSMPGLACALARDAEKRP
jgi:hypothetical protein